MINKIRELAQQNLEILERKSKDYSRDNIAATGLSGIGVRLVDKVARLNNLVRQSDAPNFESIQDTLSDIANYALIGQSVSSGDWTRSTRFVYLAGPIDGVTSEDPHADRIWRVKISHSLTKHGVSCFQPDAAFTVCNHNPPGDVVRKINRYAIDCSDVVVVYLLGDGRGIGTIREMEHAVSTGKRVIVIGDTSLSKHLDMFDVELVHSIEEAIVRIMIDATGKPNS